MKMAHKKESKIVLMSKNSRVNDDRDEVEIQDLMRKSKKSRQWVMDHPWLVGKSQRLKSGEATLQKEVKVQSGEIQTRQVKCGCS